MSIDNNYSILTAMLAPALLMAATGTLLTSANNRLARVVDRLRVLVIQWKTNELRHDALKLQILRHRTRTTYILRACLLLYFALGSFIGTSLAMALDLLSQNRFQFLPTIMGVIGVLNMLIACVFMGKEVWLSVRSFDAELDQDLKI
ncbi:MAG: DUF2721 domain-containing protein [Arenimonas sp.]|nr:DUF2721 domain-containing protein [Arenimonas sp.]